jgi:hypothetical protein
MFDKSSLARMTYEIATAARTFVRLHSELEPHPKLQAGARGTRSYVRTLTSGGKGAIRCLLYLRLFCPRFARRPPRSFSSLVEQAENHHSIEGGNEYLAVGNHRRDIFIVGKRIAAVGLIAVVKLVG